MVCGAAGIGKSSFVDLFMKKFNLQEATEVIRERDQNNGEQALG